MFHPRKETGVAGFHLQGGLWLTGLCVPPVHLCDRKETGCGGQRITVKEYLLSASATSEHRDHRVRADGSLDATLRTKGTSQTAALSDRADRDYGLRNNTCLRALNQHGKPPPTAARRDINVSHPAPLQPRGCDIDS